MVGQFSAHIWQTSVAYLNCISVEDFTKWMSFWEVLVHKQEEFPPHIRLHIHTMGWVEPDCSSRSPPSSLLLNAVCPDQLVVVSTLLQLRLVWGDGCQEHLLVGGDLTQPLVYAKWDVLQYSGRVVAPGTYIEGLISWF